MLTDLFQYKQWADQRLLQAAGRMDALAYQAEERFVRQQLHHMLIVEENFRARLSGLPEPHAANHPAQTPTLDALQARLAQSDDWYLDFVQHISPAQLAAVLDFIFVDGQAGSMTGEEILLHLLTHGSYHRGAIGHALDQAGGLRPADAYALFLHATQPERRQRSVAAGSPLPTQGRASAGESSGAQTT